MIRSHPFENIRDTFWVCSEMASVAKAGYIEVPSILEELCFGFRGPLVGWDHHRWLIETDQEEPRIEFIFKDHTLHSRPEAHFPAGFRELLSEEERVSTLWWEREFAFGERLFVEVGPADGYLQHLVRDEMAKRPPLDPPEAPSPRARVGRLLRRRSA